MVIAPFEVVRVTWGRPEIGFGETTGEGVVFSPLARLPFISDLGKNLSRFMNK
jgi:hypothetical protein